MSDNLHTTALDFERGVYSLVGEGAAATIAPLAAIGCEYTDALTGDYSKMRSGGWALLSTGGAASSVAWADITGKPNTRDGYGITDVWTAAQSDARYLSSGYVPSWASISGKPTTLGGFGITDAYTAATSDARYLLKSGGAITGTLSVSGDFSARDHYASRGDNTGAYYFGNGGAQYLYFNGTAYSLNGGGLAIGSNLSVGTGITAHGLTVPTIQWGTAAPSGSASPGDEYIQYT